MTISWLRLLFARELAAFAQELELFADERQIWVAPPGVTNTAGNLSLHVCGNLQHYVGAVLGGTGYIRNRPLEFSARSLPRIALQAELHTTAQVMETALPGLSDSALSAIYPEPVGGNRVPTGLFLLHLSSHLALHLGQAGYLRRILTGENRSSSALAITALGAAPSGATRLAIKSSRLAPRSSISCVT